MQLQAIQLITFQDATGETNYKEQLRQTYYEQLQKDEQGFAKIKDFVDENSEIQEILYKNSLKFPNAQCEMDVFLEGLTQDNARILIEVVKTSA